MLDMLEEVCIWLMDTTVASNRGTDLEEAMTQVRKTTLCYNRSNSFLEAFFYRPDSR